MYGISGWGEAIFFLSIFSFPSIDFGVIWQGWVGHSRKELGCIGKGSAWKRRWKIGKRAGSEIDLGIIVVNSYYGYGKDAKRHMLVLVQTNNITHLASSHDASHIPSLLSLCW